jgi:hypothetical protein
VIGEFVARFLVETAIFVFATLVILIYLCVCYKKTEKGNPDDKT